MRAVIYAAKSTADVHDSISGQLSDCEQLCSREGLEVSERFSEEAESAYHGDRGPELQRAMEACERLAPCALVVQHTSRLARGNVRESRHLVEIAIWAIRHGVEIRSVENPLPADNMLLLAAIAGDQDHAYSKRLGTSVSGGLARSFARGNFQGRPPDGYVVRVERDTAGRTISRTLEKDPDMEPTIRRMLDLGLQQMLPPAEIARQLNRDGMRNKRGAEWRSRDVKRLLNTATYAGILRYKGEERQDGCPRYIEPEEHQRLVARYGETLPRNMGPRRKGRRASGFLLRGLATCGRCGRKLHCHRRESGNRYYRCASMQVGDRSCYASLNADEVDAEVKRYVMDLIADFDTFRAQVLEAASSERDQAQRALDEALADVDRLDARATRIEADYMRAIDRGDDSAGETFSRLIERVTHERETAVATVGQRQAAVAALDADTVTDRMEKTATRLSSDDADAINEALHVDFETFVIDPDSGEITPMWRPPETEFDLGAALRRYQESEAGAGSKYTVPCSCGIRA